MKRKLGANATSALMLQACTLLSGFVISRIVLVQYGSQTNGLLNSIARFVSLISIMQLGVGPVIQSSFYEPVASGNHQRIRDVFCAGQSFFSRIGRALLVYTFFLSLIYPIITVDKSSFWDVSLLVLAMGTYAYILDYSCVPEQLLLSADQRAYIQNGLSILLLLINLIVIVPLMKHGWSITRVRFLSAIIFSMRVLMIKGVVRRKYPFLSKTCIKKDLAINNKWSGVARHISMFVRNETDIVLLTVRKALTDISVYSVYHNVFWGITSLVTAFFYGYVPLLGRYYALDDRGRLTDTFNSMEFQCHTVSSVIIGSALALTESFIRLFTSGVNDAQYNDAFLRMLFAGVYMLDMMTVPYNNMVLGAGKHKQTQKIYTASACINVTCSALLVGRYGIRGVLTGSVACMLYQFIALSRYTIKEISLSGMRTIIRLTFSDAITIVAIVLFGKIVLIDATSLLSWVVNACMVFSFGIVIGCGVACILDGQNAIKELRNILRTIHDW